MIRVAAVLFSVAAVLAPGVARAEQSCATNTFQISLVFGLELQGGASAVQSLDQQALGLADCLCDAKDVVVSIHVLSTSLTPQNVVPLEVWVGDGCDDPAHRAVNGSCKKIATSLASNQLSAGGIAFQPISVRDLVDPSGKAMDPCAAGSYTNALYLVFNPTTSPTEFCRYTIPVDTNSPAAPVNARAAPSTDAVEVTWETPQGGSRTPTAYQVLCAAADGAPISPHDFSNMAAYSVCTASGTVERRSVLTGGIADGMGTPPPGGGTVGVDPFANLKRVFLCSEQLDPMRIEATIGELPAGQPISFAVVGIDAIGNPSVSSVATATPLASIPRMMSPSGCHCALGGRGAQTTPFIVVVMVLVLALRRRVR
jgi:hypothetical protein